MTVTAAKRKIFLKGRATKVIKIVCSIVLAFALQGSGCRQEQQQPECKEFFTRSMDQQEKRFRDLSLEEQLTIFRCGMNRRPPSIALGYAIADGGEKIIPRLSQELRNEKDEWMQNALIDIFRVMSNKGYLRGRTDVVQQIRDTVSRMKTARIKKEAEESLKGIEKNVSSD